MPSPEPPADVVPAGSRAPRQAATLRRYIPAAALALMLVAAIGLGWHKALSLDMLAHHRDRLQDVIAQHRVVAWLAYLAAYATVVALALPGALLMTLTGGLLFGALVGGLAAALGGSVGATVLFLVARSAFGESLRRRAGPAVQRLLHGFDRDAFNYLLFLRLVPAFPFFLVNVATAIVGMPLKTFVAGTALGILPASFAFASVGAGLDSVIVAARGAQAACRASTPTAACPFEVTISSIVTYDIVLALTLLGVVALLPVAFKKWTSRNG